MARPVRLAMIVLVAVTAHGVAADDPPSARTHAIVLWQADEPECLDLDREIADQLRTLAGPPQGPGVKPPRKLSGSFSPRQLRAMHRDGRHRVFTLVIDTTGAVELVATNWLADRAFELGLARTLREWRFEPATIHGEASCFTFVLSMAFRDPE